MDPPFQELAAEIVRAVEERLDARLERQTNDLGARVKSRFDQSEERIRTHIDRFEERAERMEMHFENLEGMVKRAAEGYGATLDRIERDVSELKSSTRDGFADIKSVLSNHHARIAALEESR